MNQDPNQFPDDAHDEPSGVFGGFEEPAFEEASETVGTYTARAKEPYWKRIGGGSLFMSLLVHALFILIALFLIKFVVDKKKDEAVDFLPGGGGGGKASQAKMANKRKSVTMNTPKSRIAANVSTSTVTLPDVQTMTTDASVSGFAMPTAGGVGGGENGLRGKGKGSGMGDGMGKGMGAGSGIGFVGNLPATMRSRCSPLERAEKMRNNGGTDDCERAVVKALDWLKTKQNADGSWGTTYKSAMTGLALLAYYGHCETPDSTFYGQNVSSGITFLTDLGMKQKGFLSLNLGKNVHCVYEHGIACYAMGETYSFSKLGNKTLPNLREVFEDGVKIIVQGQQDNGNWSYDEGKSASYVKSGREDISVTGWQFQALKAARHTNLKIEGLQSAWKKAGDYLESRSQADGGFGHAGAKFPGAYSTVTMTGIGVLGLQTIGGNAGKINKGIDYLEDQMTKDPLDWKKNANLYCWYYDTQAFFQKGGKPWEKWNGQCRDILLKNQKPEGNYNPETGSQGIATSAGAGGDGEIYRTCLCTLMMEVYYRYLKVGAGGE